MAAKFGADVPTMVFGDSQVYRDGLSGRLGELTRSVQQEFEQNEAASIYRSSITSLAPHGSSTLGAITEWHQGSAPSPELVETYTRDLGHDEWTIEHFWEAQPATSW